MKKVLTYYSFIVISFMTVVGFLGASSISQLFAALIFFPLCFYFTMLVFPERKKAITFPQKEVVEPIKQKPSVEVLKLEKDLPKNVDRNRRAFVKLIGSAGVTLFLFSIFTKKAEAAFFGSVPGPGTVAIKNKAGTQIDPAEKSPTDGYTLCELDDGTTSYYGYIDKDGKWYILKEDASGHYRYAVGSSGFATSWSTRTELTYDTFDNVF